MANNKVVFDNETLIDLTEDTATEETVLQGYTFHSADGVARTGTAIAGGGDDKMDIDGENADTSVTFPNSAFTIGSRASSFDLGDVYPTELLVRSGSNEIPGNFIVYKGVIYYILSAYVKYYNEELNEWRQCSTFPIQIGNSSSNYSGKPIIYNDTYYMFGCGSSESTRRSVYWTTNPMSNEWYTKSDNLPIDFYSGCAVVYNSKIHILGSAKSGARTAHYSSDESLSWIRESTLPYDFYEGCAVVYNSKIHILGSAKSGLETNHYSWNGSSWIEESTLPYTFSKGCAIVYNNEIHILGGYNNLYTHYSWDGTTWTNRGSIPYQLMNQQYNPSGCVIIYKNHLCIVGSSSAYYKYFYSWIDEANNIWDHKQYMGVVSNDEPRKAYAIYNNKIYFKIGGSSNVYSFDGNKWEVANSSSVHEIPSVEYGIDDYPGMVLYNNRLHIFGGNASNTTYGKYHYSYSINDPSFSWTKETDIPFIFNYGCAVVYDNKIHLIGTNYNISSNASYSQKHYAWDGSSWTQLNAPPYPFAGEYAHAVVYNDVIHLIGGYYVSNSDYHLNHYIWDKNKPNSMTKLPNLPGYAESVCVYNNQLHMFGKNDHAHYILNNSTNMWYRINITLVKPDYNMSIVYNNKIYLIDSGYSIGYLYYDRDIIEIQNEKEKTFVLGDGCIAEGDYSYANGLNSSALGDYSHAEGINAYAKNDFDYIFSGSSKAGNINIPTSDTFKFGFSLSKNEIINVYDTVINGETGCCGTIIYGTSAYITLAPCGIYILCASSFDSNSYLSGHQMYYISCSTGPVSATGNVPVIINKLAGSTDILTVQSISSGTYGLAISVTLATNQKTGQFVLIRLA